MHPTTETVREFFWDDLLEFIDERKVISVVGDELVTVPDGNGGDVPLTRVLATTIAKQ